jgi:prepilin-type N-terminal cleavage/methylation domain-containing protein
MSIFSPHSIFGKRAARRALSRGFTLIELMAVISIMLILTGTILFQQNRFDSSTLLRTLAYSIALSMRQAQVYGTSLREDVGGSFNQLNTNQSTAASAYGLYFSGANSYLLFADSNSNGVYDVGTDVIVKTYVLNPGYNIYDYCITASGSNNLYCSSTSDISNMTIIFKRPNTDACIEAGGKVSDACAPGATPAETYTSAYIRVVGPTGSATDTRRTTITLTGQIFIGAKGS